MVSILSDIINHKRSEVAKRKKKLSTDYLKKAVEYAPTPASLINALTVKDACGIIAEFKPRSPSAGMINQNADIINVTSGYIAAGASAISVLTDNHFFGGSFENFILARQKNTCPILQKDFIIDEYQVYEARSLGADVILLIASALDKRKVRELAHIARSLKMETILELHTEDELDHLCSDISIVGINNRDLKTFNTDLTNSVRLADKVPDGFMKISESGIKSPADAIMLKKSGFDGFLIGSLFMKSIDPAKACKDFMLEFNDLKSKECL